MSAVVRDWRPDLIMRATAEFSSYVVAEAQSVPHVQVPMELMAIDEFVCTLVDEALAALGSQSGTTGLRTAPVLSLVPESLEDPNSWIVSTAHRFRDWQGNAGSDLGDWWTGIDAPLVYLTFGTVTASMGLFPDLYRVAIEAVAELPVRALVTLGEAGDPEVLGPLPANVHVERYWPQHPVTDGDARSDDQEPVGETGVAGAKCLVGGLPSAEHGHHDRLAGTGGHLETHPGQAVVVEAVLGVDRSPEVRLAAPSGRLRQVDGGLGRFPLAETASGILGKGRPSARAACG